MYFYLIIFSAIKLCNAVIYDLNETEYYRMPPLFHIDDYHSCLHKFKSPYCVAKFDLIAEPSNNLITLIKEYSEYTTKHYNHSYIDRGVCLTTTCKSFMNEWKNSSKPEDINTILEKCVNNTVWNEYGLEAKLSQVYYCDEIDKKKEYDWSDWWFGAAVLGLIVINIIGTFYDVIKNKAYFNSNKKPVKDNEDTSFLLCFSVFSNWRYMTSTESKDDRFEPLKGLYGLRAITAFIMPIAHALFLVTLFTDNPRDFEKSFESIHFSQIYNGLMIVQIFFTISGFLLVYVLQVNTENVQSTWRLVPQVLIYRWLRLTPMNALMIFFTATWLRHLGTGPLWNFNVTSVANDCRRFWWSHLFYFNNYISENTSCAFQTWHLAADTQIFISGLIVYLAIKRIGKSIPLSILLALSMLAPALHVWYQDLDAQMLFRPEFGRSFSCDTFRKMYVLGHNNFSAFIIGMMAGYLTYNWQKNGTYVFQHKIWKYLTWSLLPATIALFLTGNIFYVDGDRRSTVIRMAYAALYRSAMGTLTAFLIIGLVFKVENFQRSLLEWKGWVIPSRLSYGINLFHVNIIHILQGSRTQLGHVSFFHVPLAGVGMLLMRAVTLILICKSDDDNRRLCYSKFINYLGIVALSFLIVLPCYLMVEAPFTRLNKFFFKSTEKATAKKNI